jgi:FAD/FMN-containing dehydrogenase/Fe-S oxidoreductase
VDATGKAHPGLIALANRVRGEVRLGLHDRMLYATDASIYQVEPMGVVIPADLDDAVSAVSACAELALPVLPRGGGTSLAGQCVNRAVVLDLSAFCREVSGIDPDARRCHAQAGVTIDGLNAALRPTGLFFAPDPATVKQATIGGCIGNNAAGSRSIKYGRTSESVLGVEVCLADGRRVRLDAGAGGRDPVAGEFARRVAGVVGAHAALIRSRFPRTRRRNAGYALDMILDQIEAGACPEQLNLAPLICGSEGTLAVTLAADLRLHPIPASTGLAVVSFASIDEAIDAVLPLLELGPSAVELLDSLIIGLARENLEQRRHVELLPGGADARAVLYVEFQGGEEDEVGTLLARVRALFPADRVACHTAPGAMECAWGLRKAGEPLLHGIPGRRKPVGFIEDAAVPPERLGEYVRRLREAIEREGTIASYYAHASVGVLHVRPLLDLHDPADRAAMERIALTSADLAKELGGVMSGEHGDGRARGPLLERHFGPELMQAFRDIKAIFDPDNRLNPGNIVEPGPIASIHQRTRVTADGADGSRVESHGTPGSDAPRARARGLLDVSGGVSDTFYDFDHEGGLTHAAELCNGAGLCRKMSGGAMCPSYRALLDERHATRGRGNALRLAISGPIDGGAPRWDDPETKATLDLCLSCKACKSECPSNVDIARLKAEYTAQGYRASGRIPLKARVFGHIHTINRVAGIAPGLANLGMALSRPIANRLLGLHPARSLPRFEKPLRRRWTPSTSNAPAVLLYADTFTAHNEPGLALDARRVLEAFGYRVEIFDGSDAARALISVGLLGDAIRRIDREARALLDRLERAEAVLFLEPSCLSAIQDDWLGLRCVTPLGDRRRIAERSFLVEQFLEARWDDHPRRPAFVPGDARDPTGGKILVHAHCHQKALWGASSSAALLERLFPGRVRVLDTTCCGLAGSFGYTRDRFDLSMRIGELGVLPAARALGPGDVLCAPGTSCRHQVKDGAGKRAMHPIELLASTLRDR